MKAKKYRLQTVLNIRANARDEAARSVALRLEELGRAESELRSRRRNLQECLEKQDQARSSMDAALDRGAQARGAVSHRVYLKDLREQESKFTAAVENQEEIVRRVENEVESARQKLTAAAQELLAIEKHKENWLAAERIEENRTDRKITDEIGSISHGRLDNT